MIYDDVQEKRVLQQKVYDSERFMAFESARMLMDLFNSRMASKTCVTQPYKSPLVN